MSLPSFVLKAISSNEYYKKRFPDWSGAKGTNVSCPFAELTHEKGSDYSKSFSLDIGLAGGCFCHACKKKIGSILHFEKEIQEITGKDSDIVIARSLYAEFIHPVIAFDAENCNFITETQNNLASDVKLLEILQVELGFGYDEIQRFKLGWSREENRFSFPIFNQWGDLINVRYYRAPSQRKGNYPKMIHHKGYGSPNSLYPLNLLEQTPNSDKILYWMKAERDVVLAWSMGILAFCSTSGENASNKPFLFYLKRLDYQIIVCGDNDKVGVAQREQKIVDLQSVKINCGFVEIPTEFGDKDFSDWIIQRKKKAQDFRNLEIFGGVVKPQEFPSEIEILVAPNLIDATQFPLEKLYEVADIGRKPELLNCAITTKGVLSGQIDRTYTVPCVFEIEGKLYRIPICRELLQLVGVEDSSVRKTLKNVFDTNPDKILFRQFITVTEVEVVPVLNPGEDTTYVNQRCFFFGSNLESNMPYMLSVIPVAKTTTQETVGLIYNAIALSNVLDGIALTEIDKEELHHKFSLPIESLGEEIYLNLVDLADEIAERQTLMYERTDLHILQLLTWCSPLQFNFHCEGLQRGWINSLAFGDTQTGKSEIAEKLRSLFGCGVFINLENCTFVGLVGGVVKCASGMFMLRWGKIPLYNRQLVVLEELTGMSTQQISNMSDVRSSGIARLDKGGISGETSAKTRLICLSNVRREHANISDYPSGVDALQDLIGQNEDISRFDLILTLTNSEVKNDIINQDRTLRSNVMFNEEEASFFKRLIMFIWALKPSQIEITDEAYRKCLECAKELSLIYHPSIPIFKGSSGRLKLARIACAIAALQFSWDDDRSKLIVRGTHVKAATILLKKFYNKPSLGYGKFSKQKFFLEKIVDEDKLNKTVETIFSKADSKVGFFRYLVVNGVFETVELIQSLGVPSLHIERIIAAMVQSNVIKKSASSTRFTWETTVPGKHWLEKHYER